MEKIVEAFFSIMFFIFLFSLILFFVDGVKIKNKEQVNTATIATTTTQSVLKTMVCEVEIDKNGVITDSLKNCVLKFN